MINKKKTINPSSCYGYSMADKLTQLEHNEDNLEEDKKVTAVGKEIIIMRI